MVGNNVEGRCRRLFFPESLARPVEELLRPGLRGSIRFQSRVGIGLLPDGQRLQYFPHRRYLDDEGRDEREKEEQQREDECLEEGRFHGQLSGRLEG